MNKEITLTDLLLDRRKKEERYFKNYLGWAKKIKEEAEKYLKEVKVFVFGSAIKGEDCPGSDIDILIISPELKGHLKRSDILLKIQEKMDVFSPFEIHFATPKEYDFWWKHFLKEKIEI